MDITNNVVFDPDDPNIAYAASADTIYKSTDNGNTWAESAMGIDPASWVNNIAVDPQNGHVLYVATQDGQDGVYRSLDGSVSWETFNSGMPNKSVGFIVINPGDPSLLYAAPSMGLYSTKTWDYTISLPIVFK